MRTRPTALVLAALASACDCGSKPAAPGFWTGIAGRAEIVAVSPSGEPRGVVAAAPALDAAARALLSRRDGTVVVAQEVDGGAAPAVVLSRDGARVARFAAVDGAGTPLFSADARPWALAEGAGGEIWVTGGNAPVVFDAGGAFLRRAEALPYLTRGITALADGRMLVGHGVRELALYAADGAVAARPELALGTQAYQELDALLALPDGTVLVAVSRADLTTDGAVVPTRLEGDRLVATRDPGASARLPGWLPSALALGPDVAVAAPPLGTLARPACAERLTLDLSARLGCLSDAAQHGVAWVE